MPPGHSPLFRRRRLGEELRELREGKGFKLQQLAGELGWSHTKLSRLENAKVRPDVADVMDLLEALGAAPEQERRLITLARQANQRGWWRAFADMPQRQAGYAELESGTVAIREYSLTFVPGLLQTAGYIQTRFTDRDAVRDFDVETAVAGRLERQRILGQGAPVRYDVILDEAVLRRQTAPDDIWYHQISHLVTVAKQENVTVRVLRFDASVEYSSAALNSFAIYQLDDAEDEVRVSVETETSDIQLGDAEDVARYTVMWQRLERATMTTDQSASFLVELAATIDREGSR